MTEMPPIRLEVARAPDYARRSAILRLVLALPALILLGLFAGPLPRLPESWRVVPLWAFGGYAPGLLAGLSLGTGAMITFRGRYPRWWFVTHAEIVRFGARVLAYLLLLTDRYPSTDQETDVRVIIATPPVDTDRDRRIALFKVVLVLPHVLLLAAAGGFVFWSAIFAWFAAIFGMRLPASHFQRTTDVLRYGLSLYAYGFLHLTDRYPRIGDGPRPPPPAP